MKLPLYTFSFIIFIISNLTLVCGIKVLGLFPHPGVSHFHFFHPIMKGLAEKGHDVTVVSHFPDKDSIPHYKDLPLRGQDILQDSVDLKMFESRHFYNHFLEFFLLNGWGKHACENALKSKAIQEVLRLSTKQKFDIILMEQFNTDCMMGLAYVLKAPVIGLSSCALMPWHYDRIGSPIIPSYIPALFMGQSEEMTFLGRLANWISFHGLNFLYNYYSEPAATELIRRKFGNDMPAVGDLVKDTSLLFVNQHYSLSGAKPLSPAVIELGGIHIQKAKQIDADIQKILDNAKHGVIYISWGSMIRADTLPTSKRSALMRAVSRLKEKVIWKWENDTLPNQPDNVHIFKWLPQREILCHPNVKLFMSHGGLMGSSEAAYCGVPTILTPMSGDQFLNAAAMEQRGMGTLLQYEDITETNVYKLLQKTLSPKYMEAAKTVSYSYKNRPQKALDSAIWWVEHVVKTDGALLTKSISTYMPWYSYYCLDIYLFIIFLLTLSIGSWVILFNHLFGKKKPDDKKIKKN